jgi:hypothetical protein
MTWPDLAARPMTDTFQELNCLRLWDFEIHSFELLGGSDEDVLVIRASRDFSYYHNAELRFVGVEYIELPTRFHHARVRGASVDEVAALRRRVDFEGSVFCITEDSDSPDACIRYVIAKSVGIDLTTVRYHQDSSEDSV